MKTINRIKTITPENAYKLFAFLLILFCAKAFSNPKLTTDGGSASCELKDRGVKKATNATATTSGTVSKKQFYEN